MFERSKRMLTVIAVLALLVLLSPACGPTAPITATPAALPGPTLTAAAAPVTSPIPLDEPPCLTLEELGQFSLAERAAFPALCLLSPEGTTTLIEQAEHADAIRSFTGIPDLVVAFREISFAPNAPDTSLRTAVYDDDRGMEYYFAVVAGKVVEMSPRTYNPVPGPVALSEAELQEKAETLIRREYPAFDQMQDRLDFKPGTKGDLAFFRWEDNSGAAWPAMPPLAQVGLTASGEVFSYINTLYYLR